MVIFRISQEEKLVLQKTVKAIYMREKEKLNSELVVREQKMSQKEHCGSIGGESAESDVNNFQLCPRLLRF